MYSILNIRRYRVLFLFALVVMWTSLGISQQSYKPKQKNPLSENWRWKQFEELDAKGIRHLVETYNNKVWVGGDDGVLEYDGYSWKEHGKDSGLRASQVEKVLAANDGTIYVAARNGIFKYDGVQWQDHLIIPNSHNLTIFNIEQLNDQSIIACTDWGILHFLLDGAVNFYTTKHIKRTVGSIMPKVNWIYLPEGVLSSEGRIENTSDVLEGKNGDVWFAITPTEENGRLLRFKWNSIANGEFTQYEIFGRDDNLEFGEDQKLLLDQSNKLWVINSTNTKGIHVFENAKWSKTELNKIFGTDELLLDIIQLNNGTVWMSSIASVYSYKDSKWSFYTAPAFPIPANKVFLQKGINNKLWISGYKSKVLQLDLSKDKWLSYENLSFQCRSSPKETWYLEANNKVVRQSGEIWQSYGIDDGLMDAPTTVIHTSKDQIWAAGSHKGVAATAYWDGSLWRRQLHKELSWGIDYRAVFEAKDGSIWFGGAVDAELKDGFKSGLLQLLNPTEKELKFEHHIYGENGLDQSNCYGIAQSADGRIWIGGTKLLYFDGDSWQKHDDERLRQYVNCVYSYGPYLVVGSRYYGLFVYDGKVWNNYSTKEGLLDNNIISITMAGDSTILISTEKGICKFDGNSWNNDIYPDALDMNFEGGSILVDGAHIWINHVPRAWKRRGYRKDFSMDNLKFFTSRYFSDTKGPDTYVDIYQEEIGSKASNLIMWNGKDFYDQTNTSSLTFSYKLNDKPWTNFVNDKQNTFSGLDAGEYTLQIKARDADLNVDATPAIVEFRVKPPIYKQAWFLALLFTFFTIYVVYEYRVLKKKKLLEELNKSLISVNSQLVQKSGMIATQNKEMKAQQEKILQQKITLELQNDSLSETNLEIRNQKEQLESMVEKVQVLSQSRMAFFTNISHELRTPISLIIGPVKELLSKPDNLKEQPKLRMLQTIDKNASRLLILINQLLEMRRVDEGALGLQYQKIHLGDYVHDVVKLFESLARKQGVSLSFEDKTVNSITDVDTDKVEKILVNLLSNAFKFTPIDGSVKVSLDLIEQTSDNGIPAAKYFVLDVADTGAGISPENQKVIFDEYYTTDPVRLNVDNTGLGLSYVKKLLMVMGGKITVDSEEGRGSSFSVYIPYRESEIEHIGETLFDLTKAELSKLIVDNTPITSTEQEPSQKQEGQLKILIVEDNPDMKYFLSQLFIDEYIVKTASNGVEGLETLDTESFDLIISDIMMAAMDGLTFCEAVKSTRATSHIPVILLSAKTMEENKIEGFQKGADHYITKPFNPGILKLQVENLLNRRETLRTTFNQEFLLSPKKESIETNDQKLINALSDYMNEYLGEPEFNINFLCKKIGISHMHLIRKVKELTGKKPKDLLRSFRMKKAKELLLDSDYSIAEIAYKTGFNLPNSFSRTFKKEYGISPSEFLKQKSEFVKLHLHKKDK